MFGRVGDDSLVNGDSESVADNVKMDGGSGNDYMVSRGNKVTMLGGVNVLFKYASGDGNDTIVGFNSTSTLQIGNGTGTYSMNETGDDVIVKVGNGSVTLNGAASLYSVNIRGTRKYTSSTTLTLTNSSKSSVALGSAVETADASTRTKNTKITGNALANTIQGGSKKDTLYGGYGDGKDTIVGFDNNDTLTLDGLDFTASYKNKAVTLKFDDGGSIMLKSFTATTFHIDDDVYRISGSKLKKQ